MGELFQRRDQGGRANQGGTHCNYPTLRFAKWGLAGAADVPNWSDLWLASIEKLPPSTKPVAVQYADWTAACSPPPPVLLGACRSYGVRTLLVDTYDKTRGGLL